MTIRRTPVLLLVAGLCQAASAAAFDPFSRLSQTVERGNQAYEGQHFGRALEHYEQAEQELEREPRIHFNRGNALFKLGRPKEAREAYLRAMGSEDPELKKRNYFNIGNTFLSEKAYRDAVTYYRRALEIDPQLDDARYNLEIALWALRQIEKQPSSDDSERQKHKQQEDQKNRQPTEDQRDEEEKQDRKQQPGQKQKDRQDRQQDDEDPAQQQQQQQEDQGDPQQQEDQGDPQQQEDQGDPQQQEEEDQDRQQERGREPQGEKGEQEEEERSDAKQRPEEAQADGSQPPDADESEQSSERQPMDGSSAQRNGAKRLTKAQIRDLLDAERENEKPFLMHRFLLPEYKSRDKKVRKDW